jgi:hypothetical protein
MTPAGYAPLAKQQHAAAVKEDEDALKSSGSKATRVARARRERRTQRMGLHLPGLKVSHDVTQVVALVMLVVAFVFDTLLCYYIDDTRVPCGLYVSGNTCITFAEAPSSLWHSLVLTHASLPPFLLLFSDDTAAVHRRFLRSIRLWCFRLQQAHFPNLRSVCILYLVREQSLSL